MLPNATIREHAATCLDVFFQVISLPVQTESPNDRNGLLDEFGRFNLWISNIGVFADLHSSLDYRLRDFGDIKDSFSRQLATIENRLRQLHDAAQQTVSKTSIKEDEKPGISTPRKSPASAGYQDWDNTQLLQSIHQSIDWLHRLSNLVRKASFINQHKRADRFKLKDEDDNDLSDTLTDYYSKLIKREFRDIQDTLVQRLAASMLTRRRRIMYRRSQQQRWKIPQVEPKSKSLELVTPSAKSASTLLEPNALLPNERAVVSKPEAITMAPSRLTATTVDTNIRRHVSAPSGISKGSTVPLNEQSKLLVPPPPKGVKIGKDFVCDYCCLILPSKVALNNDTWADHVNKDLYPYVCVVDNCDDPIEIYSSRKEWLTHMRTRHLMRWYCMAKPHTQPLEIESEDRFMEHMKIEHPRKFRNDRLSLVAENSSRPKDPVFDDCPFCTGTSDNLEEHVALHLRDLALRSLPWPDDDERFSQREEFLHSDSSISNENTRDTIVDLMSEPLESNFSEILDDGDTSEHSAEERLRLYGHFQEIADQYKPSDLREQLSDKILARLAMKKYQQDHPRLATLIENLEAPSGDKYWHTEAFTDFEEVIGIMQQIIHVPQRERPNTGEMAVVDEHISFGPRRNVFEIAIICTLETQYNAICHIIDEFWDENDGLYGRARGNNDTHTTGRIGKHNVVLALLPQTEKPTATSTMAGLRSSYGQLEIILLVGICGGVPNIGRGGEEVEILLGDVVISNDVVHYDYIWGQFTRKDTLSGDDMTQASKNMRALIRSFETERTLEFLKKSTAQFLIEFQAKADAREKRRGNEAKFKYSYPGTANDLLYKPDNFHKHRSGADDCNVCNSGPYAICDEALQASCQEIGCEETQLVARKSLIDKQAIEQDNAHKAQEPMIHFGAIASGDIVMTSGLERDKISHQREVIAFDMDGFRVWEQIPCIIIKSVCDYANGHKDKSWQDFAAATAAAATKAVLGTYVKTNEPSWGD